MVESRKTRSSSVCKNPEVRNAVPNSYILYTDLPLNYHRPARTFTPHSTSTVALLQLWAKLCLCQNPSGFTLPVFVVVSKNPVRLLCSRAFPCSIIVVVNLKLFSDSFLVSSEFPLLIYKVNNGFETVFARQYNRDFESSGFLFSFCLWNWKEGKIWYWEIKQLKRLTLYFTRG